METTINILYDENGQYCNYHIERSFIELTLRPPDSWEDDDTAVIPLDAAMQIADAFEDSFIEN